jgi:hypothetical protein
MKFNKWTIGLAAVGVVSLASAAKAEEKASSSVMTSLASTTLSGYVDTSAQWNLSNGNANNPPYKFGGEGKADGFNLNVVQLRIESLPGAEEWAAGYRVDLWAGPDANTLNTSSFGSGSGRDFAVRQAYVALRTPVGNGLDWKVGVFDSIIGYESVESPSNPNYTRSYGHSIEPQTHTGVLTSYRFCDAFSASFGVADTIGPTINERAQTYGKAESQKTYMASFAITAPDSLGFLSGSTLYAGVVNGFSSKNSPVGLETQTSWYVGSTLATPVTGLRCGFAFDYLDRHEPGETWAISGYSSYQATEKLSVHARAEYLKDRGASRFFALTDPNLFPAGTTEAEIFALTGTAQYDLWKNVISRLEIRWDHSLKGNHIFGGNGASGTDENAWLLAANIIYKF